MKAISEGSDCRCKCVVRPLSRSACRRIEEGSATAQDFYTVETITSGPECKCACIAPPSAVNPCEGEFRLKKLREAGKENVKVKCHPVHSLCTPAMSIRHCAIVLDHWGNGYHIFYIQGRIASYFIYIEISDSGD